MACNQMQCADVNHFVGSRSGYKYISDGYINTGTDVDLCAKNYLRVSCTDTFRPVDDEQYGRIYGSTLVFLFSLCASIVGNDRI